VAGLLHGAGVLADRLVADKTDAQWDAVWSTKVDGWRALWTALQPARPRFALLFASTSGRYGNRGQADYAAANAWLCAEARALRADGVPATAICWGPWQGGMVDAALARHFAAQGIGTLPLDAGVRAAVDEVERGAEAVVVIEAPRPPRGRRTARLDPRAPELAQHALRGRAVWPVAVVAEELLALGAEVRPHEALEVRDLLVARGLSPEASVDWELRWELDGDDLAVEIHAEGRLRYRARLVTSSGAPERGPIGTLRPYPLPIAKAQSQWLFHGPLFHRIESVSGWSDSGIEVRMRPSTPAETGRTAQSWRCDPLAVDAVLQAMVLWVRAATGHAALPVALDRVACFGSPDGPIDVAVHTVRQARGGRFRALGRCGSRPGLAGDGAWTEDERLNEAFVSEAVSGQRP
jgi:hypothetical protein